MITNKELFCSVAGVIITTVPKEYSNDLLFQSAKEFGLTKEEAKIILTELRETLGYVCKKLYNNIKNEDKDFGV